jgi:23S rRNA (uridine2552-2'-O)-methyltransferase
MTEDPPKRRWKAPPKDNTPRPIAPGAETRVIGHKHAFRIKDESSKRWVERQLNDPYVIRAQAEGWRSRAAFKLIEIDDRYRLLRPGLRVVDLGAAPGGWVQVALKRGAAKVVGIDLLPIKRIAGAELMVGDVMEADTVAALLQRVSGPPDLVLSDMAANTVGHRATDHLRTVALAEMAVEFALDNLKPGGAFCAKVFQGGTEGQLLARLKQAFREVHHVKPPASRSESPELYMVAKGFRGRIPETGVPDGKAE